MSADLWDRLAASRPSDRTAAQVTSESRDTPEDRVYPRSHWKAPPKTMPPTSVMLSDPNFRDLAGTAFGRLTVIGILDAPRGRCAPQAWVVRCCCGDFEIRKAKAILNPKNNEDACFDCQRLDHLRKRETAKAMGRIRSVTVEDAVNRIKGGKL